MSIVKTCKTASIALWVGLLTASSVSFAQTFSTLAYFDSAIGSPPFSALVQGIDGNLYGTAANGGANGLGSVFRISSTGVLTNLYSFCTQTNCVDGSEPGGGLVLGVDGNLYGTTVFGGQNNIGTIFRITTKGVLTTLHSFASSDGTEPLGSLTLGSDGNFYGTAQGGGSFSSGTVFRVTRSGVLTVLHSFDFIDGFIPEAGVIQGTDGNFYGTTALGGTSTACNGGSCGTIFKVTPTGKFLSLHSFQFTDGDEPFAGLAQSSTGALYGSTYKGGNTGFEECSVGCGTIFKVSLGGAFDIIHKFNGSDGGLISNALIQATDGALYGESALGGQEGEGDIFKIVLPRALETVYSFTSAVGGGDTALVQGTGGKFYGTFEGTPSGVFSLDVGLGPFITFIQSSGKSGQTAQILGQGLAGTTSVTFNGVPATSFKIVSDTYLTTVAPNGATTGSVVVTTPSGVLTSNVSFRITK